MNQWLILTLITKKLITNPIQCCDQLTVNTGRQPINCCHQAWGSIHSGLLL
jgi:hypothetical protein